MKRRLYNVIIKYLILLSIFQTYYFISSKTGFYIPCIFRLITGYKCPGCGITHLLFHLCQFDFRNAFISNPLVFIYLPFIVIYFLYFDYLYIYNKEDKLVCNIPKFIWVLLLVITISFGFIRNIIMI